MVEPLPIGVLGLGRMGQVHARHLAGSPEARLVAAASRRPTIAWEAAARYGARAYTSDDDLLRLAEESGIDNGLVNIVFADGALGNVELSRNAAYGYDIRTEVLGSEGGLLIGGLQQTPLTMMSPAGVSHDVFPWFPERFKEAYLNEIRYFVECVRADRFPSPNGEDDRAALEIAVAATESLKSGRPVELSGRQR
jgi:predicted dehydrogenase